MKRAGVCQVLQAAQAGGYAVGAFNIHTLEMFQAVVEAARTAQKSVYIQTTPGTVRFLGASYLRALGEAAAQEAGVPLVLHLDHGDSIAVVRECLAAGYPSVMIDGSQLPYKDNVALTREVVALARKFDAAVEAELGHVGGVEEKETAAGTPGAYTDPGKAAQFVAETGVDSLAVAIGTAHGVYNSTPHLDLDRLTCIRNRVNVPLVLHGASGLTAEQVKAAVLRGICKVNIATDLKLCWASELRQALQAHPGESDPRTILKPVRAKLQELVAEKITWFST